MKEERSATGHPITFVATPEGAIKELCPREARVTMIVPEKLLDHVRGVFCVASLFFESEQAATPWLAAHPKGLSLALTVANS